MDPVPGPLLQTIDSPDDLKKLSREQLHQVSKELRQYIIDVVSVHGGHCRQSWCGGAERGPTLCL